MSSGKPQTRGLAALLRIEKERREREQAGEPEADESPPEGGQISPGTEQAAPEPPEQIEVEIPSGERLADASTEVVVHPVPEPPPASAPPSDGVSQAQDTPEGDSKQQDRDARSSEPATPLPRPVPATSSRPATSTVRRVRTQPAPAPVADPGWEKFSADWEPFLRQSVKFKLCEFFYRNTVAQGRREFKTSTAQLARVSGAHRRHIFLVLRQLEDLRFIQKESIGTNRKDEGLLIRFFPDRQA